MLYECDKCGACCTGALIVEADELDVMREPRLPQADPNYAKLPVIDVVELLQCEPGRAIVLAAGTPCEFLSAENHCEIYPTRPNACVWLQAGDDQCHQARKAVGLDELQPTRNR